MIAGFTQTPNILNFVLFQSICFRLNPFFPRPMALRCVAFQFDVTHVFEQNKVENIGARGAPWVRKFSNPLIRKILVLTSAYVRPSVRTDSGGG